MATFPSLQELAVRLMGPGAVTPLLTTDEVGEMTPDIAREMTQDTKKLFAGAGVSTGCPPAAVASVAAVFRNARNAGRDLIDTDPFLKELGITETPLHVLAMEGSLEQVIVMGRIHYCGDEGGDTRGN